MSAELQTVDCDGIATEVVSLLGSGRQVAPFSLRYPGFGLDQAYAVAAKVRRLREATGDTPVGRKIGFTNRTIWAEYGVYAPIWGYVYDRTIHNIGVVGGMLSLRGLSEPRIEPEIIFGLATAPRPGMEPADLLSCIGWVAQGFEVVQSVFPDWRFTAADTVAAFGLHGSLAIGPRHLISGSAADWLASLSGFGIDLYRNGELADRGAARNVLDGPVFALRHLVDVLARDRSNPPLAAGEIVTTGTLTRALPIQTGELWSARLAGIGLEGASVRLA